MAATKNGLRNGKTMPELFKKYWAEKKYWFIFFAALLVRILFLWQWNRTPYGDHLLIDAKEFDSWACRIAEGDWLPKGVFYLSPLYSYGLAVLYKLFGHHLLLAQAIQVIASSFSCVLFAVIGNMVFGSPVGILAGFIAVLYKPFIFYSATLLKPTWDILFSLLFILYMIRARETGRKEHSFLAGCSLGVATVLRGNMIFLAPFAPIWWAMTSVRSQDGFPASCKKIFSPKTILLSVLYCIGFFLPILPITLSNYFIGRDRVLITSAGGVSFWIGNNPNARGDLMLPKSVDLGNFTYYEEWTTRSIAESALGRPLKPSEVSKYWFGKGLSYIRERPFEWLGLFGRKFLLFWNSHEGADNYNMGFIRREFGTVLSWPLLSFGMIAPLSILGILLAFRQGGLSWALLGPGLLYMGSVVMFFVSARFRIPALAYLIPLAAYAAAGIMNGLQDRRRTLFYAAVLGAGSVLSWQKISSGDFAVAYNSLGSIYGEKKEYGKAVECFGKAIGLDPGFPFAHNNMGLIHLWQKNYDGAIPYFERTIRIAPDFAEAHMNLGCAYNGLGRTEEAVKCTEKAVQINPALEAARKNLAVLYVKQAKNTKAR